MTDEAAPEPTDASTEEADLRQRLADLQKGRRAVEAETKKVSERTQTHVGLMMTAVKEGRLPANAKEVAAVNDALQKMALGLHDTWVAQGEEEARIRQALSIITAERLTAASIRAARSTMWASWAMVLVALATMVVALVR